jgi:hypothetical protein
MKSDRFISQLTNITHFSIIVNVHFQFPFPNQRT